MLWISSDSLHKIGQTAPGWTENNQFKLYNLRSDPRETHNVAALHPDLLELMRLIVTQSHTEPANPNFRMEIPEMPL